MFDVISFIVFIIIVAILIIKDRKNVKLEGILLIRRTKRGRNFIDKVAKSHPRFWSKFSFLGVVIAIPASIFVCYFLLNNALNILSGQVKEGVRLVLPWAVGQAQFEPGLLLLPWWIWVIGIASVIIPHEFMHGIVCRIRDVRIKSIGWLLLAIIPGAFVEPDEKQLKKKDRSTKLRVYAAGSFANFITACFVWLLGFLMVLTFYTPAGVIPSAAIIGYPAANVNMSGAILTINNISIKSPQDIANILENVPVGTNIVIRTTGGIYNLTTVQHPDYNESRSFIGIAGPYKPYYEPKDAVKRMGLSDLLDGLRELLFWIFLLNIGIGLINLLPIKPLDGGLLFEELISKYLKPKVTKTIVSGVSAFFVLVLVFNLVGPSIV